MYEFSAKYAKMHRFTDIFFIFLRGEHLPHSIAWSTQPRFLDSSMPKGLWVCSYASEYVNHSKCYLNIFFKVKLTSIVINIWRKCLHETSLNKPFYFDINSTLLKRGVDYNIEDKNGARPDDLAVICGAFDCQELIERERDLFVTTQTDLIKQVM